MFKVYSIQTENVIVFSVSFVPSLFVQRIKKNKNVYRSLSLSHIVPQKYSFCHHFGSLTRPLFCKNTEENRATRKGQKKTTEISKEKKIRKYSILWVHLLFCLLLSLFVVFQHFVRFVSIWCRRRWRWRYNVIPNVRRHGLRLCAM